MKKFMIGVTVFFMVMLGLAGVITVDIRSGHMAGYQPVIDMRLKEIPVKNSGDDLALSYEFTLVIGKDTVDKAAQVFKTAKEKAAPLLVWKQMKISE